MLVQESGATTQQSASNWKACNGENQPPELVTTAYCCPFQLGAMGQPVEIFHTLINSLWTKQSLQVSLL